MAFLKRMSDNVWTFLSPARDNQGAPAPPNTVPRALKPERRRHRFTLQEAVRANRSLSPPARGWRAGSARQTATRTSAKRKIEYLSSSQERRRSKAFKSDVNELVSAGNTVLGHDDHDDLSDDDDEDEDDDDDSDELLDDSDDYESHDDEDNQASEGATDEESLLDQDDSIQSDEESGPNVDDTTVVVSEEEYERDNQGRTTLVAPEQELIDRGITAEQLRANGWDDDHIMLVHRLAMRGFEPIMPVHWQFVFRYMPDALFATSNDAVISSLSGDLHRGERALEKLFGLGAWVRDRVLLNGRITPEQQVLKQMREYIDWALEDSGLDKKSSIPLLVIQIGSVDVPLAVLQSRAEAKLARLARRYREAFRPRQSVESSPVSLSGLQTYDLPTLYALVASDTAVGLGAYRPDDLEPKLKTVAVFQMEDKAYDVWNALALAMLVCHLRNIQVRIAEDTGIGMKQPGMGDEESDDPDA